MKISKVLTSSWYPRFVPKTPVNSFKIAGWKILVLNSDTVPGKPLLCKRHGDDKTTFLDYKDLEKDFLPDDLFYSFLNFHGYQVKENAGGVLNVIPLKS